MRLRDKLQLYAYYVPSNYYRWKRAEDKRKRRISDELKLVKQVEKVFKDSDKTYVNLMFASTQLLVNPILGLQAKYGEQDFIKYPAHIKDRKKQNKCNIYKDLIIALSNLLYKIKLEKKDKKLVWKAFLNNKGFLSSLKIPKGKFGYDVMKMVYEALECKYNN